jgi:D-glycerate 3-kinase
MSVVDDFYCPVVEQIARIEIGASPLLLGIQGAQGSGKSTFALFIQRLLASEFDRRVVVMSIDDFYLTRAERFRLAKDVHPLFETRGVPGTHDTALLESTIRAMRKRSPCRIPVFDKAADDRAGEQAWQCIDGPVDIVVLEGWCVGLTAQSPAALVTPINDLERHEDVAGRWRRAVNQALGGAYQRLYSQLDYLMVLQAPNFDCVYDWRLLQEHKLQARLTEQGKPLHRLQSPAQIRRFIAHYQRLTEHALCSMPSHADCLLWLNQDHLFERITMRSEKR